jgi:hypothetical protein
LFTSHRSSKYRSFLFIQLFAFFFAPGLTASAQTRTPSTRAVVVDERLSALRSAPGFDTPFLRRLGRGRRVTIVGAASRQGFHFYRVAVTRRTRGWIQREALVVPSRRGDDERLLNLIRASSEFDRIARSRIFLETFPRSVLRPAVLLLLGDEASKVALKLTRDADRRLDPTEMKATGAPISSYFLNYNGLDRYRKLGLVFQFDPARKRYQYDGASWLELIKRYPASGEAREANLRLRGAVGRMQ